MPKSYVGIDLSAGNVALASKRYEKTTALKFQCADAQSLPFRERSFDVVINIESSHYYADRARFFAEVGRVLAPGGWFLSTHIVEPPDDVSAETVLGGMEIIERQDVTENVVRAMEIESDLRKALIEQQVPEEGRAMYEAIFGTTETDTYRKFRDRAYLYHIVRARRIDSIRSSAN
jgi:ubiquinone/menaquinone biosynthesis C-methylase UbiE